MGVDVTKNRGLQIARIVLTVLTAAAVCAIFYNSSLSAVESTEQSSPVTELLNAFLGWLHLPLRLSESIVRKLAHFTEYAVLGTLLSTTVYLYARRRKRTLIALPVGAAVAVCDELIQLFSQGRSCEVRDMLIDCVGVGFAVVLVITFISLKEKHRKRKERKEEKT